MKPRKTAVIQLRLTQGERALLDMAVAAQPTKRGRRLSHFVRGVILKEARAVVGQSEPEPESEPADDLTDRLARVCVGEL